MLIRANRTPDYFALTALDVASEIVTGKISDDAATVIASWYQSPGSIGHTLAQFASTGSADADELLSDIDATLRQLGADDPQFGMELGALREWVELANGGPF